MTTIEARFRGHQGPFLLDVDVTIPARGVTALFGPSGCGKTSVLRCIAGLNRMGEGRLVVKGSTWQEGRRFLPPHKRPIGYVFQEANLFPHLSVRENLVYGRRRSHQGSGAGSIAASLDMEEVVELLGLSALLQRSPRRLSGGERQRVAIGRALLSGPEVLLMDEPLAALDRFSKNDILPYLERLHDTLALPVLYVSHDIAEVERLADFMVLMEAGRVRAAGPLAGLLADPALPLACMPDAATVVEGRVSAYDTGYGLTTLAVAGGTLQVPGALGPEGSVHRLRISAGDVGLCRNRAPEGSSILNGPVACISAGTPFGDHQMTVFLRLGEDGSGAALLARITRKSWDSLALKPGDRVHALIKSVNLAK